MKKLTPGQRWYASQTDTIITIVKIEDGILYVNDGIAEYTAPMKFGDLDSEKMINDFYTLVDDEE